MQIRTICKRTKHLTMFELPVKAMIVHRGMSYNPHFPDAGPLLANLDACRMAMQEANVACTNGGKLETEHRRVCRRALEAALDDVYHYVRAKTHGDLQAALSSGFTLRKPPLRLPVPAPPQEVQLRRDPYTGALELRWKPTHGAMVYVVEMKHGHPGEEGGWRLFDLSMKAKLKLKGLEPGKLHAFRVQAKMAAGTTAPSQFVMGRAA